MNTVKINRKLYKYEGYWRDSLDNMVYDYNNKPFLFPTEVINNGLDNKGTNIWRLKDIFIKKLKATEDYLRRKNKFNKYTTVTYKKCLIDKKDKSISTGYYDINSFRWEDGLLHYIEKHNYKPSDEFIDFIFRFQTNPKVISRSHKFIRGKKVIKRSEVYLKLDRNQILIMDALMRHGSARIYVDKYNNQAFRYSEHFGLLDFDEQGLEKIIVSGHTSRVDEQDDEIFMPIDLVDMEEYEYYFHTHPATPLPGGRAEVGILYEFPSVSDLFHFIDNFNSGKTQGSIIVTPEGMYIIRHRDNNKKKININEDKLFNEYMKNLGKIQNDAIQIYGTNFNSETFYSKIAQDTSHIDKFNKVINKYELQVDFFPRSKDKKGHWIIDTVYLPVSVQEII